MSQANTDKPGRTDKTDTQTRQAEMRICINLIYEYIYIYIYIYILKIHTHRQTNRCIHASISFYWKQCSHLISSHLIPSYPIQSNPIPSHFISSHLISSNLISSHLISSHLISSHLSLSLCPSHQQCSYISICVGASQLNIHPSIHPCTEVYVYLVGPFKKTSPVPYHPSARQFHAESVAGISMFQNRPKRCCWSTLLLMDIDGYRWISMIHINPNGKMVMTWGPVRCTKSLGFLWFLCIQFASASTYP